MLNFSDIQIFFALGVLGVNFVRTSKQLSEQKRIAIEKGISSTKFSLLEMSIGLQALPFVMYTIFRGQIGHSIIFPIVVVLSFAPSIIIADSVGDILDRGYDYQKRASSVIKVFIWVGWFGLIYFSGFWAVMYLAYQKSL